MLSKMRDKLWNTREKALSQTVLAVQNAGSLPIILCSEAARSLVKSLSKRMFPDLVVLSVSEIHDDFFVESIGEITLAE
jgi:flagellar biosynthesis protein FlhA